MPPALRGGFRMIRELWRRVTFKRVSCFKCGFLQRGGTSFGLGLSNPITESERDHYDFGNFIECFMDAADLEDESEPTHEEYMKDLSESLLIQTVTKPRRCFSFTRFMPDLLPKEHVPSLLERQRQRAQNWRTAWVVAGTLAAAIAYMVLRD